MTVPRMEVLPDLFIVPDIDGCKARVTFTAPAGCTGARWEISDADGPVAAGSVATARLNSPKSAAGQEVAFDAAIDGMKLWNVDTPHLYTLTLALAVAGQTVRTAETFGMRKIEARRDFIHVNGQPFLVRGPIRGREAHDHANLENLPEEEYFARYIRAAKAYGFNFIRFHSRVPSEACFAAADRLGIFLHVEVRLYYGKYQKQRQMMDDAGELVDEANWIETIQRLRNHPSLMVYCLGNEIRHPGANPQVAKIAALTRRLDPTRLFIDTCAHGEFDRTYVDIDVQHMSYFYPFGKDYDMFENTQNWLIYGSCTGLPTVEPPAEEAGAAQVRRSIAPPRPVLAHEVCHYVALRDLDALEAKFARPAVTAERPWWIAELRKLLRLKGLEGDYSKMLQASRVFQMRNWKLGIEAARRSPILAGFHFLQLADTERYENSNGVIDCFDEPTGVEERAFRRFNGDTVILADLPRRTYFGGQRLIVPVVLSHFSPDIGGMADFAFSLAGDGVDIAGGLHRIDLDARGRREICRVKIDLPRVDSPRALRLAFTLAGPGCSVENDWNIWLYPDAPERLAFPPVTAELDEVDIARRYRHFRSTGTLEKPERLLIVNRFGEAVLRHLAEGGDVLMLYRVPETRDRRKRAAREKYYLPATWDRFKGVVWDRGTNLGAFIRPSPALAGFPNDGFLDMQFHGLLDDSDKIVLDDFPAVVEPIIQGVDKASRDRFDVFTFKLSELQPAWTMRKFAHLLELRVGKGRLLVTGMNFTGLAGGVPETCAMFESLVRHVASEAFAPAARITPADLGEYLLRKAAAPRVKERMMTQYWQLNEEPLESKQYWQDAEAYIREG